MAKGREQPPKKSPSVTPMRVPAHGRGALRVGGTNRGGPGRPPSLLRRVAREAWFDRVQIITGIADKDTATDGDRLRAMDSLARVGLNAAISEDDVRERLSATLETLRAECPAALYERLLPKLRAVWT